MSNVKKYPEGSTGRDIVDDVVESRKHLHREIYDNIRSNPAYYGAVSIGQSPLQFATVKNKKAIEPRSLVEDIIRSAESIRLDDGPAEVRTLADEVTVHNTHPAIVKLIKACVAGSYTPSYPYTQAVSDFAYQLMYSCDRLCLPITRMGNSSVGIEVSSIDGRIADAVYADLNTYLKELCDKNGIKYTDTIEVPTGKKGLSSLFKAAEG